MIEEIRADVIFCVDYDENIDHRAVTMFFDEALGEILTAAPDYDPLVLKGFTYSTAFRAPADFYDSVNLLSTVNPDGERMENGVYPLGRARAPARWTAALFRARSRNAGALPFQENTKARCSGALRRASQRR